ncbi:polysaccharide pyruvyl transferase family protein [Mesorhizobium sp. SARCC-RB16n]|uniref:polysaccharide pyruvyl transferase family protein n=1 Tax=Mesorhizobium sp. SARCC-RB16n TaxID=2116687 RepID=UPI001666B621|nr:polysaccharide pyruvyl transferase family protein [Mesorhizobium sp. SARCC-RB16n]
MTLYLKQYSAVPNAGDVASALITSRISGEDVRIVGEPPCNRPNLVGLGSILHWADENSIIWGSGFISENVILPVNPKSIAAVRGLLTYDRLRRQGFPCAAVFGDPGVFISDMYPRSETTLPLGIVPHYVDADEPFVQRAREDGAEILDVLSPFDKFIRTLSACERIITSSLHGLIFAHAYGIPAVWVKLSGRVVGDGFKFMDYYSSVGIKGLDVPLFGPDASLSVLERNCSLPPSSIDKVALREALLGELPKLRMPGGRHRIANQRQADPFEHLREAARPRVAERVAKSLLFDPEEYLSLHEDLHNPPIEPFQHYVCSGLYEKRRVTAARSLARVLGTVQADYPLLAKRHIAKFEADQLDVRKHAEFVSQTEVAVYLHSRSNYDAYPIAQALVCALRAAGVTCHLANEHTELPSRTTVSIVVSPHEFFEDDVPETFRRPEFVMNCVMLNTAQAFSSRFVSDLPWLYMAAGILDLVFQTSMLWERCGVPASHVWPPLAIEQRSQMIDDFDPSNALVNWMSPDTLKRVGAIEPIADRPLDILLTGYETQPRTQFLLRNARYLASKDCFLGYENVPDAPLPYNESTRARQAIYLGISMLSKSVIDISRYQIGSLNWTRAMALGFSCETPLVTTASLQTPFFQPDLHYFEAPGRHMDGVVRWVIDSKDGLSRAQTHAAEARKVLDTRLTSARVGRQIISFLARLSS